MAERWILHRAHDWRLALPVAAGILVCARCGMLAEVGRWDGPRCEPQHAPASSGFQPEPHGQDPRA